ncbi:AsmA family protein [Sneathiella sp.]|uniref:AsmA family protein n=2 Tax=Sneathiella sp. TaxID=1964365 RepID=UPI0025CC2204|nr:AsmA family protein [Sneathiella sp.]
MKKAIIALIVILILIVGAVVALPFIVPTDRIKQELISATNEATGRELAINGDFSLSFFPTLGVTADMVTFSNAEGAEEASMTTIQSLAIKLRLLPLITGKVQVDEFILDKPVINLEVDQAGKGNWVFDAAASDAEKPAENADESAGGSGFGISDLNLGDVRIVDGVVNFLDRQNDTSINLSDIDVGLTLQGLDQPFTAEGSALWNNEKLELDVNVATLRAILENMETTATVSLASKHVNASFDGQVKSTQPLNLGGTTTLDVPSVRELAAWTGTPLEVAGEGFQALSIKGELGVNDTTYSFTNAELAFDAIKGTGDFSVNLGGKVPDVVGKLALETLDLNPYLPADQAGGETAPATPAEKPASAEKWDTTPIDLSALKTVNAKFDLSVQEILVQQIKIGASALATVLKDGILNVDLTEMNLYDGTGQASIEVNAQQPVLTVSKTVTIQDVQLKPLLTDAADFRKLEGKGMVQADISTSGKSQADMINALNGNGQILFQDGSISGINLAAMARNLTSAFTENSSLQKTDFAEISGTYVIKNGILTNDDLKMLNPFIRLSGSGTVELPPQTVNYRIEPQLVASTEGQGGTEASGVGVPILVTGSWDNLQYAPDLAGTLKNVNPENVKKIIDDAKGAGDNLKDSLKGGAEKDSGGVKNLLDAAGGLLGGKKN